MRRISSIALGLEEDVTFSELLCTQNQILPPRDFSLDPTISQDTIQLMQKALIFPNMTSFTLEEMIEDMLMALQSGAAQEPYFETNQQFDDLANNNNSLAPASELALEPGTAEPNDEEVLDTTQEFTVDLAMKAIFVSETVSNLNRSIQRTKFNDHDGVFFDDSWIIILCELQSIRHRKVVIARLACEMYLMPSCQAARVVVLILGNSDERGLRAAIQTGTSFATVLSHPSLLSDLADAENSQEILELFTARINDLIKEGTGILELAGMDLALEDDIFELEPPFAGIKEDIKRRLPYYFDDFTDGFVGYKTKQKLVAAIVFQYFATILPVIALGHTIDYVTNHKLSTKTVIYSQFMGSILYGIFSGNPMMMFQVSSVILLYCKVLYLFAVYNNYDFNLLLDLTCFFSGLFLILTSIFNLSNLMVYSRGSVADMVDVFQTITFVQSVSSDILSAHEQFNCPKQQSQKCNPGKFVLNIFTIFITIVVASVFHGLRHSRLFTASVREFLSDMGTPFGVISSTIVVSTVFSPVSLNTFTYQDSAVAFKLVDFSNAGFITITLSFLLALPLSMLIFLDHNLNMEFVSNSANKLHKGSCPHFDMLVIGIINALLGLFGMCPMQGIFPNTPLHIKQMGDVEITHDQGVQVKTLIRVRDTRLTQLIVGILVGLSTFLLPLPLGYFPRSALNGLLLVIGFISMEGNSLIDRFKLFFTDQIPVNVAHKFTFTQVIQLAIISYVSFSNVNVLTILFPICLALLIPIRIVLLPFIFEAKYLITLDPPKALQELTQG